MSGGWAALDPGRSKCGLVRCDPARQAVIAARIEPAEACLRQLEHWRAEGLEGVVLGDGTSSGVWPERLHRLGLSVAMVDERGSTLAARQRYWELLPPRGWRRLLPRGLRLPPRPVDDVVAQLLLERWLGHDLSRPLELEPPLRQQERRAREAQKRARTVKA
jgi:RNase H-fold protein (predicted Holliday junction resolvase)